MIINLIGQPGAGKTTIATELIKFFESTNQPTINIDGDQLREIFKNKSYSKTGRMKNIQNAYNIALFLEHKGFIPIISLVSPYIKLREDLKKKTRVIEVMVKTSEIRGREKFHVADYEFPDSNYVLLDTTGKKAEDMAKIILKNL